MRWFVLALGVVAADGAEAGVLDTPPAFGNEHGAIDAQSVSDCVARIGENLNQGFVEDARTECAGTATIACLEDSDKSGDGIYSRLSYATCLEQERRYWEWRLERVTDGLSGAYVDGGPSDFLRNTVPELEALVSVWRAYLVVQFSYQTSQYGVGPGRGREGDIQELACLSNRTAAFALDLEFRLRAHCESQLRNHYGDACEFSR